MQFSKQTIKNTVKIYETTTRWIAQLDLIVRLAFEIDNLKRCKPANICVTLFGVYSIHSFLSVLRYHWLLSIFYVFFVRNY